MMNEYINRYDDKCTVMDKVKNTPIELCADYYDDNEMITSSCGLQFPAYSGVTALQHAIGSDIIVPPECGVFISAVVEYLTAEMMELAGNVAREEGMREINESHIWKCVKNDTELLAYFNMLTSKDRDESTKTDGDISNMDLFTPLRIAMERNDLDMMHSLIIAGETNQYPIATALRVGSVKTLRELWYDDSVKFPSLVCEDDGNTQSGYCDCWLVHEVITKDGNTREIVFPCCEDTYYVTLVNAVCASLPGKLIDAIVAYITAPSVAIEPTENDEEKRVLFVATECGFSRERSYEFGPTPIGVCETFDEAYRLIISEAVDMANEDGGDRTVPEILPTTRHELKALLPQAKNDYGEYERHSWINVFCHGKCIAFSIGIWECGTHFSVKQVAHPAT